MPSRRHPESSVRTFAHSGSDAGTLDTPAIALRVPATAAELDAAREIFSEYARGLDVDLCFQSFDAELAGCGAMRAAREADYANACEMKRLYVRPGFRGFGLGRVLAEALLDEARRAGYSAMLLDTLDDMEAARDLYTTLGFVEIPPYYYNPIPGAHYLKVDLA